MKNTWCYPPSKENKLNRVLLINWLAPHAIKYKDGARRKRVPSLVMLSCLCAPTRICPSLSCQEITAPLGDLPCEYNAVLLHYMGSSFRFSYKFLESLPGDLQAEAAAAPVSRPWKQITANLDPLHCLRTLCHSTSRSYSKNKAFSQGKKRPHLKSSGFSNWATNLELLKDCLSRTRDVAQPVAWSPGLCI